jgi:3-dehydroquinate synthetase
VARDERESGERKLLNLGHTFAHGIEHAAGYGRVPHGVAVAVGVGLALRASARTGLLADPSLEGRVARVAARLGLPGDLPELRRRSRLALAPEAILAGMRHDKKGSAARPAFVLVRGPGRLESDQDLEPAALAELLA